MAALDPTTLKKLLSGEPLRVVFWDLECTHLSGMIGRILCCSFKPLGGRVYTFRGDQPGFWDPDKGDIADDSKLAAAIRDELEKYDIIVGHNSKRFDSPFLDARLFKAGLRPREPRFHVDTMWIIRSHLRISSKLANVQEFLPIEDKKTPITWDDWARAGAFFGEGMDRVVKHCEQDVKVLEKVYLHLLPYIKDLRKG